MDPMQAVSAACAASLAVPTVCTRCSHPHTCGAGHEQIALIRGWLCRSVYFHSWEADRAVPAGNVSWPKVDLPSSIWHEQCLLQGHRGSCILPSVLVLAPLQNQAHVREVPGDGRLPCG